MDFRYSILLNIFRKSRGDGLFPLFAWQAFQCSFTKDQRLHFNLFVRLLRHRMLCGQRKGPFRNGPFLLIQLAFLVINLQRTQNIVEGAVEGSGLALWRHGQHVKQTAIP